MPVKQWKASYNPYYPSSALLTNGIDYGNIFAELSFKNVISVYIKNLIKYPLQLLRIHLSGSHIIWGINQGKN